MNPVSVPTSLQKEFLNIPFYFGGFGVLGIFIFLLGFILLSINFFKKTDKDNKNKSHDQKTKMNKDGKIALIIAYIDLFSIAIFVPYFLPIK